MSCLLWWSQFTRLAKWQVWDRGGWYRSGLSAWTRGCRHRLFEEVNPYCDWVRPLVHPCMWCHLAPHACGYHLCSDRGLGVNPYDAQVISHSFEPEGGRTLFLAQNETKRDGAASCVVASEYFRAFSRLSPYNQSFLGGEPWAFSLVFLFSKLS